MIKQNYLWETRERQQHKFISKIDGYLKGKAVPLQPWSGPEGSRKLRFPDFMTTAQDDGKVVSRCNPKS